MRHKDERGQTIRDMKSKVAINRENFYKKKSRRHLKAVIDHSDKFDTYRTMRERLESTLGELNEEIEYTAISKNGVPLHSNYVDTEVIRQGEEFQSKTKQKERDHNKKQVELRLMKAFSSLQLPYQQRNESKTKTPQHKADVDHNSNNCGARMQSTITSDPDSKQFNSNTPLGVTDGNALTFTIGEISNMTAMEESNKSRARMFQIDQKYKMKPIQKVMRATQFNQFKHFKDKSNVAGLLKNNVGCLCEDQIQTADDLQSDQQSA